MPAEELGYTLVEQQRAGDVFVMAENAAKAGKIYLPIIRMKAGAEGTNPMPYTTLV